METIINNLGNPSWWFTGIFFGVIVPLAIKKSSAKFKIFARKYLAKQKWRIKRARNSIADLQYEISKASALSIMFFITCCLYLVWFVSGPLITLLAESKPLFILAIMPVYIVEVIWLSQDKLAVKAIEEYNRIRVKRGSSLLRLQKGAASTRRPARGPRFNQALMSVAWC